MTTALQIPTTIHLGPHKYKIHSELGQGGFATVYRAESEDGVDVAIKLIPQDPGARRELRFENLDGVPNVVAVQDRGEWNGHYVLVMPLADKSLRQHIADNGGRLSTEEALHVLLDVAKALEGLEKSEVVHRDIKPANILFWDGKWCLADFGIARYAEATTSKNTRKFAKTPAYAAPEQWREERATTATDVYAMGIVAYELMSGHRPFSGDSAALRNQHLNENPPPIAHLPTNVQSLMVDCLRKPQESRPSPSDLVLRMDDMLKRPVSLASARLQEANQMAVTRQSERELQMSRIQNEKERREGLFTAATQAFMGVVEMLGTSIEKDAPAVDVSHNLIQQVQGSEKSLRVQFVPTGTDRPEWNCSGNTTLVFELNRAQLTISPVHMVRYPNPDMRYKEPFQVVAFSEIAVVYTDDLSRYRGRSHALWYCDANDQGRLRWYETAFMSLSFGGNRFSPPGIEPFSLPPGNDSFLALSPTIHTLQRAWPHMPIDQGEESNFVERWIDYFGQAASGELRRPSVMPELPLD